MFGIVSYVIILTFFLSSPVPNYLDATVSTVQKIHETLPAGDVLAFLTGQDEVEQALRRLM